jgi:hypothetical protein
MNATSMTEAEMFAQIEATEKEQAEAARVTERNAQLEAERKAVAVRNRKLAEAIAAHIVPAHVWKIDDRGRLSIDGVDVWYQVEVTEIWTKGHGMLGRGSKPTGQIRLVVGSYGDRVSFPPRKDGTHNYKRIAEILVAHAQTVNRKKQMSNQQSANEVVAKETREMLGMTQYGSAMSISASSSAERPLFVSFEIKRAMSCEEALALHAALKSLGLVK